MTVIRLGYFIDRLISNFRANGLHITNYSLKVNGLQLSDANGFGLQ